MIRLTFSKSDSHDRQRWILEVHVLDFQGDLYGQDVKVQFYKWMRPEKRFSNPEELIQQIQLDVRDTRNLFQ